MQNLRCYFPSFSVKIGLVRNLLAKQKVFFRLKSTGRLGLRNEIIKKPMAEKPKMFGSQGPPIFTTIALRCGLFTFVSLNSVFVGSMIWNYENWRATSNWRSTQGKYRSFKERFNNAFAQIFGRSPKQSDIFWVIASINLIVFLLNNSRRGPTFLRYFTISPYGPWPATSMLLTLFSHQMFFHMFLNLYVLQNFTQPILNILGMEQFVALFIGGGIFSSFLSIMSKAARRSTIPSIGASGAICALLGAFCMLQPSAQLCVPGLVNIIPHSFTAGTAAYFMLAFEFLGATIFILRSPIDHAAHLGGLVFGMYYGMEGKTIMLKKREQIVTAWRQLKGDSSP